MAVESMIDTLIEVAQELRKVAIESDRSDLKWKVVEQLSELMELRDSLRSQDEPDASVTGTHFEITPDDTVIESPNEDASAKEAGDLLEEGGMVVIQPSSDGETYGISQDSKSDIPEAADPISAKANEEMSAPNSKTSHKGNSSEAPSTDCELAEQRIRELEPRHQAILERMNNILTEEQKVVKRSVTLEGRAAGKQTKQIQKEVLSAIHLTEKQAKLMAAKRQELKEIREQIAAQVDGLLSPEQKQELQKRIARESRQ